ncbi:MAG: metal ABC transporter ATP-binding protein [Phycisphaeraceae bacterium]|nr:metal ABC transporter ATP-binding protein [Phycisphaeraceae bacterium]
MADSPAIDAIGVTFTYPGQSRPAVDRVSLRVEIGERLGILGPNGGGKSTLLKLVLGLLRPDSGSISILGQTARSARESGVVGYVPQRIEAQLSFPISARQAASMPVARAVPPWRPLAQEARARVDRSLELVGASSFADHPVGSLSGGQLQRIMIARAIACGPRVLLLDEPTVGIDVAGQQRFSDMLKGLHESLGLAIVIVSHDIRAIAAGCDRVACLNRTLHSHTAPQGLTPQVLAEVFSHDLRGAFGDVHVDAHAASDCHDPSHHHHEHAHPTEPPA